MLLGYNTNGLSNHDALEGLGLLVKTGYQSVALTIDHGWLNPFAPDRDVQFQKIKHFLDGNGIATVIETGARFLLDPEVKHSPTLIHDSTEGVESRIEFLKYCIDVAVDLNSKCVSIWSGVRPEHVSTRAAMDRLVRNLSTVLEYAEQREMDIGFEPEPGMLIDTTGRFERLLHLVDSPRLKMTLDIGHLFCLNEVPISNYIEKWSDRLVNVHLEDMIAGVHEHLMFGDGQIHFPPVIESLRSAGYQNGIHVELSRHSHDAVRTLKASFDFLSPIIEATMVGDNLDGYDW